MTPTGGHNASNCGFGLLGVAFGVVALLAALMVLREASKENLPMVRTGGTAAPEIPALTLPQFYLVRGVQIDDAGKILLRCTRKPAKSGTFPDDLQATGDDGQTYAVGDVILIDRNEDGAFYALPGEPIHQLEVK